MSLEVSGEHPVPARRLVLASWMGDPADPAGWSGTPHNLMRALQAAHVSVTPCSSKPSRWRLGPAVLTAYATGRWFEPLRSSPGRRAFQAALAERLVSEGRASVLHMGELDLPFRSDGRRHYLYVDSTLDLYLKSPTRGDLGGKPGRRNAEASTIRGFAQVDHFFPIAGYVAENLIRDYGIHPSRVTVVGTGRGRITPFSGEKDFSQGHVLFVAKGRVREKGGYLLVEAFKRLRAQGCEVPLVIVGAVELAEAVQGMRNVEVHGFVDWEKLEQLFHRAILFAMPALHEPWGLVYLEALAARAPILGLRRNAFPEIAANGAFGFLIADDSPQSVAEGVLEALSDRRRLRLMAAAGQAHCLAHYTWERTAGRIIDGIESTGGFAP